MKMSIQWHEGCIANTSAYLERQRKHIEKLLEIQEKELQSLEFYRKQLEKAKELGLDSFDQDRFLKNRTK